MFHADLAAGAWIFSALFLFSNGPPNKSQKPLKTSASGKAAVKENTSPPLLRHRRWENFICGFSATKNPTFKKRKLASLPGWVGEEKKKNQADWWIACSLISQRSVEYLQLCHKLIGRG